MKKLILALCGATALLTTSAYGESQKILNASYDIARELYAKVNEQFIPYYKNETGIDLTIDQSHAGSSKQARSILEGLQADVVTFNQVTDIDILAKNGFVAKDWQKAYPNNASPYYSFPSFLVRAGNPKNIRNWDDLVREDVKVVFPNPKTSGNARYTYLAAYAFAKVKYGSDEKSQEFVRKLFKNVPVFDTGGRGATTTFIERNIGDVLITFETETLNIAKEFGTDKVETVTPEVSLKAEFPVAVVDKVADKRGTKKIAQDYLSYLYSKDGQKLLAENGNRVNDQEIVAGYADRFAKIRLLTVEDVFGSWDAVQNEHFASGKILDTLYEGR